jgi:hypothetical protein
VVGSCPKTHARTVIERSKSYNKDLHPEGPASVVELSVRGTVENTGRVIVSEFIALVHSNIVLCLLGFACLNVAGRTANENTFVGCGMVDTLNPLLR